MEARLSGAGSKGRIAPSPELQAAGAALLLVDERGTVLGSAGWKEAFGDPAPAVIRDGGGDGEALLEAVASIVAEARQRRGRVRRCVEISLDRHRTYSISAGPVAGDGPEPETAVLALDITDGFRAGPKEGEAIRQLGHDLRSPLTSMSGAVEMLQMGRLGRLSAEQTRLVGMLQQGIELMLSLIDEATVHYRAAAGCDVPGRSAISGGGVGG